MAKEFKAMCQVEGYHPAQEFDWTHEFALVDAHNNNTIVLNTSDKGLWTVGQTYRIVIEDNLEG